MPNNTQNNINIIGVFYILLQRNLINLSQTAFVNSVFCCVKLDGRGSIWTAYAKGAVFYVNEWKMVLREAAAIDM